MATTTLRPPTAPKRVKSSSGSPIVIILAVVCVLLAGGAGFFLVQNNELTAQRDQAREGLVSIASAAGSGALTAEDAQNSELIDEAMGNLAGEVETMVADLQTARAEVTRQRGELNDANAALEAASAQASSLRGQIQDLREELQTSRNESAAMTQQHQQEISQLNEQISGMTAQMAALEASAEELNGQIAGLEQANTEAGQEIERLRKQLASRPAAPSAPAAATAETSTEVMEDEFGSDMQAEEEASAVDPEEMTMAVADGASRYFSSIFFNKANNTLSLTALDGRTLTYFDVPVAIYDGLASAPVMDVYFRFRLLDQYASDPVDIDFLRSLD
jgi:peptidoglycan hydrolase CwlO-like protein